MSSSKTIEEDNLKKALAVIITDYAFVNSEDKDIVIAIDHAMEAINTYIREVCEEVIGSRDDDAKYVELSKHKQRKVIIEYKLRVEQRKRLKELL